MAKKPATPVDQLKSALPGLRRTYAHIRPHLRSHRLLMAGGLVAMFAEVIFRLLEPWPLKFVLDAVIQPDAGVQPGIMGLITIAAIAVVGAAALRALSSYLMTVCFALAGNRALTSVRAQVYAHLQTLSLRFHHGSRSGDLVTRLTGDVGRLQEVAVTAALPLVGNIVALFGMMVVMFVLDWRLALVVLGAFPIFLVGSAQQGRKITGAARKQRQGEGRLAGAAGETLSAMTVVQTYSLEKALQGQFAASNQKTLKDGVKATRLSAGLERCTDLLVGLAAGLVLLIGAQRVLAGGLSPGELTVFISYLKSAFKPMRDLAKYTGRLAKAAASGERIVDLLETLPEVADRPDAITAPRLRGEVHFDGVVAEYGRGRRALVDVDLHVPAGTRVGILGPSGSGKSTLAALLPRLQDPAYGKVTVDGIDLRDMTVESLRSQIAVVLQESVLFATTIEENIRYGREDATTEQIQEAAQRANAHDFIEALPEGYQTVVAERGATLSGGQRQRIAIARAMLRDASIVVLDEATTGLDSTSARSVLEAISRLAAGRTTFVITHKPADVLDCDLAIWIEEGRITDQGTPAEVLSRHHLPDVATVTPLADRRRRIADAG